MTPTSNRADDRLLTAIVLFAAQVILLSGGLAGADVVVLENGGRIEGTLLDAKKSPRDKYIIETAAGGRVTLEKSQVKEIIGQTASEEEYEKVRRQYPDTVDGQMALAHWCRDHHLPKQREKHLEHLLELDPNHAEAHRLLKHLWVGGSWKSRRQYFEDQGYIQYLGQWMTPQEMELKEAARKTELAEKTWKRKLKMWRGWLGGPSEKEQQAFDELSRISDPFATRALTDALAAEKVDDYRKRYVEALAHIDTPAAWMVLCNRALIDTDEEVRLTCLDYVTERPVPAFTDYFVSRLRDKENVVINRAAMALGRLKDRRAISPLIDVLRTEHIHVVAPAQPGTTAGFGSINGGPSSGGFSFGNSGPKLVKREYTNADVLSSLVTLTGQNYDFDEAAWKTWYASQKRALSLNARRDGQ